MRRHLLTGLVVSGLVVLQACVVVALYFAVKGWERADDLATTVQGEVADRTAQFCGLQVARVRDLERQVHQTRHYLASPAGREKSGINTAVRVNFPRTLHAARRERAHTPRICFRVTR
jgi:hypothetical protein